MPEKKQGSNEKTESLTQALASFHDEFARFNDQSAFLCAALACVLADEDYHNGRVVRGAECWVFWMRQQMNHFEARIRQLQKAAVNESPSTG